MAVQGEHVVELLAGIEMPSRLDMPVKTLVDLQEATRTTY